MFLAGADGETPELRPPSFKGAMRFWWRAMNGHLTLKELKKEESELFGSSDEKIGRSKVTIRIRQTRLNTDSFKPVPTKRFRKNGIKPKQSFSLIISSTHENIKMYNNILKITLILGGFGKRSRRGFGSIKILKINGESISNQCNQTDHIKDLINCIGENNYNITDDKIIFNKKGKERYPFCKEIQLGKEYDDWEELMKKIGQAAHNHNVNSLGYARGGRFASPIYVSVIKNSNNKFLPIISTLNTAFDDKNKKVDYKIQNKFKEMIL